MYNFSNYTLRPFFNSLKSIHVSIILIFYLFSAFGQSGSDCPTGATETFEKVTGVTVAAILNGGAELYASADGGDGVVTAECNNR